MGHFLPSHLSQRGGRHVHHQRSCKRALQIIVVCLESVRRIGRTLARFLQQPCFSSQQSLFWTIQLSHPSANFSKGERFYDYPNCHQCNHCRNCLLAKVRVTGFEPAASWLQTTHSSKLSYTLISQAPGSRTQNPRLPKPVCFYPHPCLIFAALSSSESCVIDSVAIPGTDPTTRLP